MPLPLLLLPAAFLAAPVAVPLGLVVGVASAAGAVLTAGAYGIFRLVTFAQTTSPIPPIEMERQSTNKILQTLHANIGDVQQKITTSTATLSNSAADVRASAELVANASAELTSIQDRATLNVENMKELIQQLQSFDQQITEKSQEFQTATQRLTDGITPQLMQTHTELERLQQVINQHAESTTELEAIIVERERQIQELKAANANKDKIIEKKSGQIDTLLRQARQLIGIAQSYSARIAPINAAMEVTGNQQMPMK